jgi:hypothetical protein
MAMSEEDFERMLQRMEKPDDICFRCALIALFLAMPTPCWLGPMRFGEATASSLRVVFPFQLRVKAG